MGVKQRAQNCICPYLVISPRADGRLQSQAGDGAARAASCFIPVIFITGMGLCFGFQRNSFFLTDAFTSKNVRFEGEVCPIRCGRAKNPCGTLGYGNCTGYRHNPT